MATPLADPGQRIEVQPLGAALRGAATATLLRSARLAVVRLVVPAGKDIPPHQAAGDITVHCLEGRVAFTALGQTQELTAGQILWLPGGEPHSLKGIEDASLLVTRAL
jgi:quercetin dioxygenase-like cupin family protein